VGRAASVAQVLLDTPLPQLDHPFDYSVPEGLRDSVVPGVRVKVPLRGGTRFMDGYVLSLSSTSDFVGDLQAIESVVSPVSLLTPELYDLARAVADRQAGSVVDVLRLAIPTRYVRAEATYLAERSAHDGQRAVADDQVTPPTREYLQPPVGMSQLASGPWVPAWVTALALRARQHLARGESSILIVPDARDLEHLRHELGEQPDVVFVNATQTGAERYVAYLRCLESEPLIIVGNRSAVYAPAWNLGLIAMWDEGDPSLHEPLAPYAHPRDVALVRQSLEPSCSLVFASHSCSPAIARLIDMDWVQHSHDPLFRPPLLVSTDVLLDAGEAEEYSARIPPEVFLAVKDALMLGPVLVQVGMKGFAPSLACHNCRERARCRECSGPLMQEARGAVPRCRWCGALASAWACSSCSGTVLRASSAGAVSTADQLGRAFPGVRVIATDSEHPVEQVPHTPALVVATPGAEPLADGGYEAVIILDGELLRRRESLFVSEDALRLWSNAAALVAPEATVHLVGAGTRLGAVMQEWAQRDFASQQLAERAALGLPPIVRLCSVVGPQDHVRQLCDELGTIPSVRVRGPVSWGEGISRALVTCAHRDGTEVARLVRAAIVRGAMTTPVKQSRDEFARRASRLKARFDDTQIDVVGKDS
jgi:primosomal protein N' (replication factor Y)